MTTTTLAFILAVTLQAPGAERCNVAPHYLDAYREILAMKQPTGQVATVNHLVLVRDVAELTLERGQLFLLPPVGGCTVGAVFRGEGRFKLVPSLLLEQAELERVDGKASLDAPITEAILIFMDSTPQQLGGLRFTAAEVPGAVGDHVNDLLNSLKGKESGSFSGMVLGPLLNGDRTGFFMARVERASGGPLLFSFDPERIEAVQLARSVDRSDWGSSWAAIAQFPSGTAQPVPDMWAFRERVLIPHYQVETWLTPTGTADLDFAAAATLTVTAADSAGPWLRLSLHGELDVDSARWGASSAPYFKAEDHDDVWVRAPRRIAPGDTLTLKVAYHGNLIDRYDSWFFIDPLADWWPGNRQGRDLATFELTFHSPSWYPIASIGERTDSTVDGKVLTTKWVTRKREQFATFNLGLFEVSRIKPLGGPPLDLLISEEGHRTLRRRLREAYARDEEGVFLPEQRNMREAVANDVSNSLSYFTSLFGEPPFQHYWVTEIPYSLGVSFPGVIHLSWVTFQNTALDGFDEYFRAHEVAHQWWGNGVRPASYRDAWLAEGLATFSGLWYLQGARKGSKEYFKFLDQYAADIGFNRKDAGPIWLGSRTASPRAPRAYHVMIYEKGAWVFHMLRALMFDLQTKKDDRFVDMMRDFYRYYQGGSATTDDFQRVVERHAGVPMGWFFDQWVRGSAIPTFRVAWRNEPADGGRHRVRLRVKQEGVPVDFRSVVLVSADLGENRFANFRISVDGTKQEYLSPLLPVEAKRVVFNELHSVLGEVKTESW
jgi:hypothetical protein